MGSGRQRRQLFEEQLFTDEFLLTVIYKKDYQFEKNIKKKTTKIIQNEVQATTP